MVEDLVLGCWVFPRFGASAGYNQGLLARLGDIVSRLHMGLYEVPDLKGALIQDLEQLSPHGVKIKVAICHLRVSGSDAFEGTVWRL